MKNSKLKIIETKELSDGSACFSIEMSKDCEEMIKNAGKEILKLEGVETQDEQLILDLGFEHILKIGMETSKQNQCCGGECEGNCDCTCNDSKIITEETATQEDIEDVMDRR